MHTAENGKTLSLGDYFLRDNLFGEMEFFSQTSPVHSVSLQPPARNWWLFLKRSLPIFLLQDGHIAFWMNHRMSNIYINTMGIAIERSLYPLKFNIIKDLISRHTSVGASLGHTYMYQEAQRFGCTERAYTRIIHELIKEGLVRKDSDSSAIVPVDIKALQSYLEDYYQ
ncbi:Crp/Fnr family transcriptional regulator [Vibrio sinaloensis]|nr:Crp/Fnr family transcriptional regulator [Vibrio sinaloensis]